MLDIKINEMAQRGILADIHARAVMDYNGDAVLDSSTMFEVGGEILRGDEIVPLVIRDLQARLCSDGAVLRSLKPALEANTPCYSTTAAAQVARAYNDGMRMLQLLEGRPEFGLAQGLFNEAVATAHNAASNATYMAHHDGKILRFVCEKPAYPVYMGEMEEFGLSKTYTVGSSL